MVDFNYYCDVIMLTPFCSLEYWTCGVPGEFVALAVAMKVVPEDGRGLFRPQRDPQVGEYGRSALLDIGNLERKENLIIMSCVG